MRMTRAFSFALIGEIGFLQMLINLFMNDLEKKMPRYFDEDTGQPLHLYFGRHLATIDGVKVKLEGVPLLKNECTGKVILTFESSAMINYFVEQAKENGQYAIKITPRSRESKKYGYCQKVDFLYSDIDYEHIPGLSRPWNKGFLTPVFFKLSVLNKYSQTPGYKLDLFSESYGRIDTENWDICFGVNCNQLVVMWLGDIDSLPLEEQYYLRSENVESDHDIHSEFYNAQIDCIASPPSKQSQLLQARADLDKLVSKRKKFSLYRLQGEVGRVIEHLHRPHFWEDRHVEPVIEALTKIIVESLNVGDLKNQILDKDAMIEVESLGSLKIFELWLSCFTRINDIYSVLTPFYVLYDYRIVCAHLTSDKSRVKKLKKINSRLGLDKENISNMAIYDMLIERLIESFSRLLIEIEK